MKKFAYSFSSPELIQSGSVWAADAVQAGAIVARHFSAMGYQQAAKISVEPC